MNISDIENAISYYAISENDRIIINGGEPTLHPKIRHIFNMLSKTNAEIVIYSNGRMFAHEYFLKIILENNINRITIPIHGNKKLHNMITTTNSFNETILGINNLIKLKKDNFIIEVKFIINDYFVSEKIDICELLINNFKHECINNIIIAGMVENYISKMNHISTNWDKVGIYISEQINNLFNINPNIKIKFEDIPLCKLNNTLQQDILHYYDSSFNQDFNSFHVFDFKHNNGKYINYKVQSCLLNTKEYCDKYELCNSIMKNYMVLSFYKKRFYLELE